MERWDERQGSVSLPWLWHALLSQWKWVAAGIVLGLGIAAGILIFGERRYEAQVKLLVESPTGASFGASGLATLVGVGSPDINTQVEILTARPLLEEVQRRAGISEPYRDFERRFRASAVRNTNVVQAFAAASTPESAQRLAEIWVSTYLSYVRTLYEKNPSMLVEKLERELQAQEAKLRQVAQRLTAFLKQHKVVAPEQELTKGVEKYADLLEQLRELEGRKVAVERQIQTVRRQLQREPRFYEASRNLAVPPEVQQLNTKIAELRIQRHALLQEYQPDAPEVKIIEEQIAQAERERAKLLARAVDEHFLPLAKQEAVNPIYLELVKALFQAESERQAVQASLQVLRQQQAWFEKLFRATPDLMAEYADLKRQYEAALTVWTEKVRAYEQARAQQLVGKVSPVLLQPPALPDRPIFPRPVLTMGLGVILGAMVGALGALMAAARTRKLSNRWEVERLLGVPVLAEVRGTLTPAQAHLVSWQLRALGGGEVWHRALALPLTPRVEAVAQQIAATLSNGNEQTTEPNLPAPVPVNGVLAVYTAALSAPIAPDAERLLLVAPKGYVLDEATHQMLLQTGSRLVGVILVEEASA